MYMYEEGPLDLRSALPLLLLPLLFMSPMLLLLLLMMVMSMRIVTWRL